MRFLQICQTGFLAITLAAIANDALAVTQQWDGSSNNVFGNPFNWTPFGIPGDGDTATITGGVPNAAPVILLSDTDAIDGLTINGGASLVTNGHQLWVDDTVFSLPIQFDSSRTVIGAAGQLIVNTGVSGGPDANVDFLTIQSGGRLAFATGGGLTERAILQADRTVSNLVGGVIASNGNGEIQLLTLLNNDGLIIVSDHELILRPVPDVTGVTVDLDGALENGSIVVADDAFFGVTHSVSATGSEEIELTDTFDGQITIGNRATLFVNADLSLAPSSLLIGIDGKLSTWGELNVGLDDIGNPVSLDLRPLVGRITVGEAAESDTTTSSSLRISVADEASTGGAVMNISDGALIDTRDSSHSLNTNTVTIGGPVDSAGTINVEGVGTGLLATAMTVGQIGDGTLNITGGAQVVAEGNVWLTERIGVTSTRTGTVLVDGPGSSFSIDGYFDVGTRTNGTGLVTVSDGGRIDGEQVFLGPEPGSVGRLTVTDTDSEVRFNYIEIGQFFTSLAADGGDGQMIVQNNATALVTNGIQLGSSVSSWDRAELSVTSGGLVDAGTSITVHNDVVGSGVSRINLDDGEVRATIFKNDDELNAVGNSRIRAGLAGTVSIFFGDTSDNTITGGLTLDGDTLIESGATFGGFGNLRVNDGHVLYLEDSASLIGVHLLNDGHVQLGESAGSVGNGSAQTYQQATDASLTVTLSGEAFNDFDSLGTKGDIELDGTLNIELSDFEPLPGSTFKILTATSGTILGEFAQIVQPSGAAVRFGADYNFSDVVLTAFFAGDADTDGDVDGADFLLIQRTEPGLIPIWKAQYGSVSTAAVGSASVPEPATSLMLLLSLVGCVVRRPVRCYSY